MAELEDIARLVARIMDLSMNALLDQGTKNEDQEKRVSDLSHSSLSASTVIAVKPAVRNPAPAIEPFPSIRTPANLLPTPNLPIRIPPTPVTLSNNKSDFFPTPESPPIAPHHPIVNREIMKKRWKHIERRKPFAQNASSKLQAIIGMRNETPFQVPETPVPPTILNMMRQVRGQNNIYGRGGFLNSIRGYGRSGLQRGGGYNIPVKAPIRMHVVNRFTGAGLREFLLTRGNEVGSMKLELQSISFHDFTPDIRTNAEGSVMLARYDSREPRCRCTYYEVDLPTVRRSTLTPSQEIYSTERWIWCLISRPMITIDLDPSINPSQRSSLPPNFPDPIPTSWVVFAAPLSHITTYPATSGLGRDIPNPAHNPTNIDKNNPSHLCLVDKRLDFDFSHQGIPLFEFSSLNHFNTSVTLPFLSINNPVPPYDDDNDTYMPYTDDEYEEILSRWEQSEEFEKRNRAIDDPMGLPCPNRGAWWNHFYKELYEDCKTWEKIKAAMGRGKCRVVCQWVERREFADEKEVSRKGGNNDIWDNSRRFRSGMGGCGSSYRGGHGAFRGRRYMGRGGAPNSQVYGPGQPQVMNQRPRSSLSESF